MSDQFSDTQLRSMKRENERLRDELAALVAHRDSLEKDRTRLRTGVQRALDHCGFCDGAGRVPRIGEAEIYDDGSWSLRTDGATPCPRCVWLSLALEAGDDGE